MGVSKLVFNCIKTKAVGNFQRPVIKRSNMPQSIEKEMTRKNAVFTFCLFQPRASDPNESIKVSHSKAQFLAEKNLKSIRGSDIYMVIYRSF